MARARRQTGRLARMSRHRAFAVALAALALLLFCWPFVRLPRLPLMRADLYLFGAWTALIVILWLTSRWLGPDDRGGDDHA